MNPFNPLHTMRKTTKTPLAKSILTLLASALAASVASTAHGAARTWNGAGADDN